MDVRVARVFAVLMLMLIIVPYGMTAASLNQQFRAEMEPFIAKLKGDACRTYSLVCETKNPGAVTCASGGRDRCVPIVHKYNGIPCGKRNDTACFATVEQGVGAMAAIVFGKIRSGCTSIYSILENCEYSSSKAGNDSWKYARTIESWTGIGMNEKMDVNNAIQMGKLITAMARYESGNAGVAFNIDQLEKGFAYAYGKEQLPAFTPGFVPGVGPFVAPPGASRVPPYGLNEIIPRSQFGAYPSQGAVPAQGATPAQGSSPTQPSSVDTQPGVVTGGTRAALIIQVQPQNIKVGQHILVSWASVNMKPGTCKVTKNDADFAIGMEASRPDFATAGTSKYVMQCETAGGQQATAEATVSIQ